MARDDFFVRFWGVRGSIPSPGSHTAGYGGNTPCLEVRCADHLLVFDAGSGARRLGNSLTQASDTGSLDLFFTHCHYDHIEGLPFFSPLHDKGWNIRMWSGHLAAPMDTETMVAQFMERPYFPIGPDCFRAAVTYRDFTPGKTLHPQHGIEVRTAVLNHPDGAVGYRVDYRGRSICYVTDTEHVPGKPDKAVLDLISGADIVIYDCAYSDETFSKYVGYGHSTWQEGIRLCETANVGQFVVFHHLPGLRDEALDRIAASVESMRPGSLVAREGLVLRPGA